MLVCQELPCTFLYTNVSARKITHLCSGPGSVKYTHYLTEYIIYISLNICIKSKWLFISILHILFLRWSNNCFYRIHVFPHDALLSVSVYSRQKRLFKLESIGHRYLPDNCLLLVVGQERKKQCMPRQIQKLEMRNTNEQIVGKHFYLGGHLSCVFHEQQDIRN